jgi:hypothetical protein
LRKDKVGRVLRPPQADEKPDKITQMHAFWQTGVNMFKRAIPTIIIVAMACISAFDMAAAQESRVIHFQGLLTGPDGGPLRTDIYDVIFSIWDQESGDTQPIWSETQVVEVTEGLFDVFLGSVDALSADVFTHAEGESELRYLEIQVVGDDPMTPRTQIAKTPSSFLSSRVLGDVQTGPGSFRMFDPQQEPPAGDPLIEMRTTAEGASYFTMNNPSGEEIGPMVEMTSDPSSSSGISIHLAEPTFASSVALFNNMYDGGNVVLYRNGPVPHDEKVAIEMTSSSEAAYLSMYDLVSNTDPSKTLEIADLPSTGASIRMFNPQPEPPVPVVELSGSPSLGSFKMFNPQPELPTSDPLIEFRTTADDVSYFTMNNPSGEEIGPMIEMTSDPFSTSGISIHLAEPTFASSVRLFNNMYDGGNIVLYRNGLVPHDEKPAIEMTSSSEAAYLSMYDLEDDIDPGKTLEMSTLPLTGASIKMFDPGTRDLSISLDSDGEIQARKQTIGNSTNDGDCNLVMGSLSSAGGDYNFVGGYQAQSDYNNCFLWADYNANQPMASSAANQFLVRATGGTGFYSNANFTSGVFLGPGASSWYSIIPPGPELNTRPVDGEEILTKIERLPLQYYSHKDRENSVEHIGPVAGDFNELFGFDGGDTYISMRDESGVALAGVKELINIINDLKEENRMLERRISELEKR